MLGKHCTLSHAARPEDVYAYHSFGEESNYVVAREAANKPTGLRQLLLPTPSVTLTLKEPCAGEPVPTHLPCPELEPR